MAMKNIANKSHAGTFCCTAEGRSGAEASAARRSTSASTSSRSMSQAPGVVRTLGQRALDARDARGGEHVGDRSAHGSLASRSSTAGSTAGPEVTRTATGVSSSSAVLNPLSNT